MDSILLKQSPLEQVFRDFLETQLGRVRACLEEFFVLEKTLEEECRLEFCECVEDAQRASIDFLNAFFQESTSDPELQSGNTELDSALRTFVEEFKELRQSACCSIREAAPLCCPWESMEEERKKAIECFRNLKFAGNKVVYAVRQATASGSDEPDEVKKLGSTNTDENSA